MHSQKMTAGAITAALREVLIHEHAHAVVARSFGHIGTVDVTPAASHFIGGFSFATGVPPNDPRARGLIALAGWCAQCLDSNPATSAQELMADARHGHHTVSAADFALLGDVIREDAVNECLSLLRSLWHEISEAVARDMTSPNWGSTTL